MNIFRKKIHVLIVVLIVAVSSIVYAQYSGSSISRFDQKDLTNMINGDEGSLKGEWIEVSNDAMVVISANAMNSRPTGYPHFYLSRNWEHCIEYTDDVPQGQACSMIFNDVLKNTNTFLSKR